MRIIIFPIVSLLVLIAGGIFIFNYRQRVEYVAPEPAPSEKSSQIKGIYAGPAKNQLYFKNLLQETELNGIVIDVKEYDGVNLPSSLKKFIQDLRKENVWVIARMVVFRDSSLVVEKPEWYLTATSSPWQDGAGNYWLDPQNQQVQDYIIEFSKKVIDFGFDELQFDYIRYPDDYPAEGERQKVIGNFFLRVVKELKDYQPSIILSVDLFGYIATQYNSFDIGQRLIDAGKTFDYLSFMLYPSHFYAGFHAKEIHYFYPEVVEHPYEVVYYSILSAVDYLSLFGLETKIRPWLQDFDLSADREKGIFYDAGKVRMQIVAAQSAQVSGWLLWNPLYIYTKDALDKTW